MCRHRQKVFVSRSVCSCLTWLNTFEQSMMVWSHLCAHKMAAIRHFHTRYVGMWIHMCICAYVHVCITWCGYADICTQIVCLFVCLFNVYKCVLYVWINLGLSGILALVGFITHHQSCLCLCLSVSACQWAEALSCGTQYFLLACNFMA